MARGKVASVRLPDELVERLDELVPQLARDPAWKTLTVNRSLATKLAIQWGVEAAEKRYRDKK